VRLRIVVLGLLLAGCASASPSLSPSLAPSGEPAPSPTQSDLPIPTVEPTPAPIPIDQAIFERRFTVLIAGADTSASRRAGGLDDVNTDALMVVSVSADKSRIAILSLPRDTVDLPMPDGSVYRGKVNGIAQRFGMETLRGAMSKLIGAPIDRYLRVDMDDFAWMVDVVGGIDVEVKTRIADSKVHLFVGPGPAHLDGATALAFSRTRADSDYGRAARQQQVVLALVGKWLSPGAAALVGSIRLLGSLQTDIGLNELTTLLAIGRASASAEVDAIVLKPPRFALFVGIEPNTSRGWVMIPNLSEIRAYAKSVLAD
jgi:LCP family protein required for cell wall assembly